MILVVPAASAIALGHKKYLLPVVLGVLFAAMIDPGGEYGRRMWAMAQFALAGALLTALGLVSAEGRGDTRYSPPSSSPYWPD